MGWLEHRHGLGRPHWLAGVLILAIMAAPLDALAAEDGGSTRSVIHIVTMQDMRFEPETLTVKPGDTVTWVNKDLVPHTATAQSQAFNSQAITAGASWTYTAGKSGSYPYGCLFHPGMHATLIVQ